MRQAGMPAAVGKPMAAAEAEAVATEVDGAGFVEAAVAAAVVRCPRVLEPSTWRGRACVPRNSNRR